MEKTTAYKSTDGKIYEKEEDAAEADRRDKVSRRYKRFCGIFGEEYIARTSDNYYRWDDIGGVQGTLRRLAEDKELFSRLLAAWDDAE